MAEYNQQKGMLVFFAVACGFAMGVAYSSYAESKARDDLWKRIPKNSQAKILEQYEEEDSRYDKDPDADLDYRPG